MQTCGKEIRNTDARNIFDGRSTVEYLREREREIKNNDNE